MDFAIPQLYDPALNLSESYFKNGMDAWIDNGFRCLIFGASEYERTSGRPRLKDGSVMARYLALAKQAINPKTAILWENRPVNEHFKQWRI